MTPRDETLKTVENQKYKATVKENSHSFDGYHVCNYTITRNVTKVVAYQKAYEETTLCGWWIPWQTCSKTHYRTEYHTIEVPETMNFTDCCQGYERVSLYCVLSLNRSNEFASKPGTCPARGLEDFNDPCVYDIDCPALQKCCNSSKGSVCAVPFPQGMNRTRYWYIATIVVKMDLKDLRRIDPKLLHHIRLLHSVITGALRPGNTSVHYLSTVPSRAFTISSQLLVGFCSLQSLADVSSQLSEIPMRLPEVIDVDVQDFDECLSPSENDCSESAKCINILGTYMCECTTAIDADPSHPGHVCTELLPSSKFAAVVPGTTTSMAVTDRGGMPVSTENATASMLTAVHSTQTKMASANTLFSSIGNRMPVSPSTSWITTNQRTTDSKILAGLQQSHPLLTSISSSDVVRLNFSETWLQNTTNSSHTFNTTYIMTEDPAANTSSLLREITYPFTTSGQDMVNSSRNQPNFSTSSAALLSFVSSAPGDCVLHPHPARRLMATNVSSTSFTVSWSANPPLTSHFRVLLLQGDQNLSDIRTGNMSFTAWGLEPGALYTVKILTESCGQESKETQLMLRTAVQILEGRARIINANYTPGLSNSSTEEYQNFTQLFIADVYKSLPSHILNSVNVGQIKMVITNLTTGSVVVDFHLLIDMPLNTLDVSSAFFSSLGNTSHFLINISDLSIHDYNECKNYVDDCCLHATCTNTYGFYNCSCNEGFTDLSPHWPGRACEAVQQNSTFTPQAPSPEQQPRPTFGTILGTTFHPKVTKAQAFLSLTHDMSLKDAARVNCEIKYIVITMEKSFLKQKSIPESSLYLGQPQCNVKTSNETHVELRAGWTECGTLVQSNRTHTMVNTTLRNIMPSQKPMQHIQLMSPIRCLFPNDVLASSGYTPEGGLYTIIEDLQGDGSFQPEFQLFDGNNPIPKNSTLSPSDEVRIQVQITTEDSQFKVVLTECWATPTSNSLDPVSFAFINGSCALPNTFTVMLENGVSHKAQFKTKIFAFVNTSVVYLHCKLHICMEAPGKTCKTSCSSFRSLKSSDIYVTRHASWGPLCQGVSDYHLRSTKDDYLAPEYIALIVIAICVFVAGVTTLVACHRRRKTGRYDFKLKSDNVGYQVFNN
ncbi:uromodulin-like 1 [Microcaecilia unicolor]|uniref:Uromodulin-like 1 n=1 Tax=Microcaecilia unicolor TaxID=1415580 RepID=A0A6P7Y7C9_9AMPH|nr:uromodulin-like 1 [Microcaecilia unicolor]